MVNIYCQRFCLLSNLDIAKIALKSCTRNCLSLELQCVSLPSCCFVGTACPSIVGLEISRDGRGPMVPVSPPLDSSGLTIIRMLLPQPEVVTSVLLRLYKPRDSSNIGLSQIRLLGNTTFNSNLQGEDEEFSIDSRFVKHYVCPKL